MSQSLPVIGHWIDGQTVLGSPRSQEVYNPATGVAEKRVLLAEKSTVEAAVASAEKAYPAWRATPPLKRARVMSNLKVLLEKHAEEICALLTAEHGKVAGDALGELQRGIENVEYASYATQLLKGEHSRNVGPGIDSWSEFQPLGVTAGITPFNFPAMVPLWMWPMAVACGNTFVLKPSEKVPLSAIREVELAHEAGLPAGVLNLVTGGPAVVDHLITHEDVKAVSFVGSTKVAQHIYKTATAAGKRAQCMGGAKNYMVIMPDANQDAAIEGIVGSAFGNSGQRCLAGSVCIAVGDTGEWLIPKLKAAAAKIKVAAGTESGVGMGPVIDDASKKRIEGFIASGEQDGAKLVLDGRKCPMPSKGCFVGPTIFDQVRPGMKIVDEEIFGPVLSVVREATLDAALATLNRSRYGNMGVIFTSSGYNARRFKTHAQVGMIGINVGVPAPMAVFPFAGWKQSFFGDLHANGEDAAKFWTESKVVVARWM